MPTLVLDPQPQALIELQRQREKAGLDRLDEVWEGVLHMTPAPAHQHARITQQLAEVLGPLARAAGLEPTMHEFNIGEGEHDFRVPDGGLHQPPVPADQVWHPTAALVVEVVSPGDETWQKLAFYASHSVQELLIVDPQKRKVDWLALRSTQYEPVERSGLIELGAGALTELLDW